MRMPFLLAPFLAAAAIAVPAMAFPNSDPLAQFAQADVNHDGKVTRLEFLAARAVRFDQLDRQGRGYITEADFPRLISLRPRASQRVGALFAAADIDHDGRVTRWEFDHAPTPIFDRADANHDGVVDRAEMEALAAATRREGGL